MVDYFITYLIIFRIIVILAGCFSIFLGFLLFQNLPPRRRRTSEETSTELKIDVSKSIFILKNGAPGIFYALFGVIIIFMMLVNGNPELQIKPIEDISKITLQSDIDPESQSMSIYLRSNEISKIDRIISDYEHGYYENKLEEALEELIEVLRK